MNVTRKTNLRSGGQVLVDALEVHGCRFAYLVPGESYLAVLDALHDSTIRSIGARHEGGAAMMAEAFGKLTGEPGVAMVTRGPGATNAAHGLHIAHQDSTPMILFVGQVARGASDREAFQEIDYRRMFGETTKWVGQIEDPARIPEFVSRAYHTALAGRPGPVVLALPEDMLVEPSDVSDAKPHRVADVTPDPEAMFELRERLSAAKRPVVLAGGPGWDRVARDNLKRFAEANGLPVGVSFRAQDRFDNAHPNYAGHAGVGIDPALAARIKASDLVIALGARLGEATTSGYTLFDVPVPKQALVHVHPSAEELGRVYQPTLPIHASVGAFLRAAVEMEPVDGSVWAGELEAARADYLEHATPTTIPGDLQLGEAIAWLSDHAPDDAIISNGAGNFAIWLHRFFKYSGRRTQLGPTSGSMGYEMPAAVAAKLEAPERMVLSFSGDGGFQMTGNELATAVQHKLPIIAFVVNNGLYGTIRMHQERDYPGRNTGTELYNPDFMKLAEAYGAHGERVARTQDFAPAFERAVASGKPALIELRIDPEAITPTATLTGLRKAALAKARG
jgi:acetolactate synthase I/II/III large subunit